MRIAVLGAGAWGTSLAVALGARHRTTLWMRSRAQLAKLAATRTNPYLPGIAIPASVALSDDLAAVARDAELLIAATPTAGLRDALRALPAEPGAIGLLWGCKGFELASSRLPHEIVAETLPRWSRVGALSGPSFALEVARGLPAALTIASRDAAFAQQAAAALEPHVRLGKLNTEAEQQLAARFNIRSIPTLAVFLGGREIARQSGAMDLATLKRWIASALAQA